MTHEDMTSNVRTPPENQEKVYHYWVSFFRVMMGRPKEAAALCDLGMQIVLAEAILGLGARRSVDRILRRKHESDDPTAA